MPVTLKLSKRFYDHFGQEHTDEFMNVVHAIDESYRTEFRELFEAHFGRLEARMAALAIELRGELTQLDMRTGSQLKQLETRTAAQLGALRNDFKQHEARTASQVAALHGDFKQLETRLDARLEALKSDLLKWTFLFWVGTIGIVLAVVKL